MTEDEGRDALARHIIRAAAQARAIGLDVPDVVSAVAWALGEVLAQTTALEPARPVATCVPVIAAGFQAAREGHGLGA